MRSYLRQGGWQPYQAPQRPGRLAAHGDWLAERFRQHRGNFDVVRQQLQREHGLTVSLRTVERAVAHLRREVLAQTRHRRRTSGRRELVARPSTAEASPPPSAPAELLPPLAEYETALGGGW